MIGRDILSLGGENFKNKTQRGIQAARGNEKKKGVTCICLFKRGGRFGGEKQAPAT